jgi:transposase
MDIIGLDLHKRESQLSIRAEDGTIAERRIVTSRERFTAVLGDRPRARILLEASTESEWVARHLESLGHEVIVADPNHAPMYANRSRRTKTDKRDARTLLDACETNAYRPTHRLSEARRHVRAELAVRDALVRTRTRSIALAKALVRRDGLRVPTSASSWVPTRIAELGLSPALATELTPLFAVYAPLNEQIAAVSRPRACAAARTTGRLHPGGAAPERPADGRAGPLESGGQGAHATQPTTPARPAHRTGDGRGIASEEQHTDNRKRGHFY